MFRFTFVVHDKHVLDLMRALSGRVMELDVAPFKNAVEKKGKITQKTDGRMCEMIVDYMREKDLKEVTGPQVKSFIGEIGGSPESYSHHINEAVKHKLLKKIGRGKGNSVRYQRVLLREV